MSEEMAEAIARLEKMQAAEADLARLRRLTVRIFDECDAYMLGPKDEGYPVTGELPPDPNCPYCDGTGRILRDGAMRVLPHSVVTVTDDTFLVFPASWMEADNA